MQITLQSSLCSFSIDSCYLFLPIVLVAFFTVFWSNLSIGDYDMAGAKFRLVDFVCKVEFWKGIVAESYVVVNVFVIRG